MPATGDTISVLCACGKKLKAPASAVGRRAKCPACANVLTIELPPPPLEEIHEVAPEIAEDDPLGAMYDLAETEKAAAHSQHLDDSPRCPKCASSMQAGAILCTNCGFDTRSNKKVAAAPIARTVVEQSTKKKPVDKMAPDGKFAIGLAVSLALGLAGGLVWFLITWATGINLYIVCAIVGAGAGIGMQIGQKGYSSLGGLGAVGMALIALLIFRFAIVVTVLLPAADRPGTANGLYAPGMGVVVAKPLSTNSAGPDGAFSRTHSASDAMSDPLFWPVFFSVKGCIMIILALFLAYRTAAEFVSG